MLGSSLGKSLTDAEREQMKTMMREQSQAASAAQQQAEQTAEGRKDARVAYKKGEGNTAFKAGEYQQAAVFYTEALTLDETQHTIYSNRAFCFLKLGRYSQAREDAQACIKLMPSFAKGHFRLALALQAEDKPADACAAFGKCLEIEPNNKDAIAGLNMARMQAERQSARAGGTGGRELSAEIRERALGVSEKIKLHEAIQTIRQTLLEEEGLYSRVDLWRVVCVSPLLDQFGIRANPRELPRNIARVVNVFAHEDEQLRGDRGGLLSCRAKDKVGAGALVIELLLQPRQWLSLKSLGCYHLLRPSPKPVARRVGIQARPRTTRLRCVCRDANRLHHHRRRKACRRVLHQRKHKRRPNARADEQAFIDSNLVEHGKLVVSHAVPTTSERAVRAAGVALVHGNNLELVVRKLRPRVKRLALPHCDARLKAARRE